MLLQDKQIAIIGGGPGGLTLARLLQLKGSNVKVYERDLNKDARVQASPLDMHEESGVAALRKAGLIKYLKKNVRQGADRKIIVNERAEIFFSDHETKQDEDLINENSRPETPIIPRPIYCMPLDQTWRALPNLTLLGDTAHVMPPFAGEGANTSMLDALELSECLTSDKYKTLREAISFYEVSMRQRASIAAKQSLENGERMHSEGALEKMLSIFSVN